MIKRDAHKLVKVDWSFAGCNYTRGAVCTSCGKLANEVTALDMLHWACAERDIATLEALLVAGVDPNEESFTEKMNIHQGASKIVPRVVLLKASRDGHTDVVACLLKHCASAGIRSHYDGGLSLHCAAANGHADVVRLLIDTPMDGSDGLLSCGDRYINNEIDHLAAIDHASIGGHADVVRVLLERGSRQAMPRDMYELWNRLARKLPLWD